jgi:tRNA modification GTPase
MNRNIGSNTIVAVSTGEGLGAIAGIRISGETAFLIVEKILDPPEKFNNSEFQKIHVFNVISPAQKKTIDQITAIKYKAPFSFTGEDMVELFCHGGEYIVGKILSMLIEEGAILAGKGEFTRRAFLHGKIDLIQAEAILAMIESRNERENDGAVSAYLGKSRKTIERWKCTVKELLRDIEAEIEFPEESDIQNSTFDHKGNIDLVKKEIEMDIKKKEKIKIIEKGINVPIVGIPNAGKSSLFNLLLEFERTIVHSEEGTTRDIVGEQLQICGEKIHLLDTAGLRETESPVEKMGIEKTWEAIQGAPFIIWVTPADTSITRLEKFCVEEKSQGRVVCIISKVDRAHGTEKKKYCKALNIPIYPVCLLHREQRMRLVDFIGDHLKERVGIIDSPSVIRTARHELVARQILGKLEAASNHYNFGEEILAQYLKSVLDDLSEFVGETTSEEILNDIFSKFCIGK